MTKIQKLLRELPKVDEVLLNEQLFLCKDLQFNINPENILPSYYPHTSYTAPIGSPISR